MESPARDSGYSVLHSQETETEFCSNSHTSLSELSTSATSAPTIHDGVTRGATENPSQSTLALVESSQSSPYGISLFKGYGLFIWYL